MPSASSRGDRERQASRLRDAVERAAHLLPAQGPIGAFVHHNPLHAFEGEPFEAAVLRASQAFGFEPYLLEHEYRRRLQRGRIRQRDLDATLERELGGRTDESIAFDRTRVELRRLILARGLRDATGQRLDWLLTETPALRRFRADASVGAGVAAGRRPGGGHRAEREASLVRALFRACLAGVARCPPPPAPAAPAVERHRDHLLAAGHADVDDWIHPTLIRFVSAYLDQGLAQWSMPGRERGMLACFVDLHRNRLGGLFGGWRTELTRVLADEPAGGDGWASLEHSLEELGVAPALWAPYLVAEAQALRGWAGMVRQFEERPDRLPGHPVPARLVDFLAVRLLLVRAATARACRQACLPTRLDELRATSIRAVPAKPADTLLERAWRLFDVAQLCGGDAAAVDALTRRELEALERELGEFGSLERRRVLHLAFERALYGRFLDALAQHPEQPSPRPPAYQVVFCIDEREESIRRHLEEVDPDVETLGIAGFFGVAMYFRSSRDARARPLCPVAITPRIYVGEVRPPPRGWAARWLGTQRRLMGMVDKNIHLGSRTLGRGAIIMATLGVLWIVPLVLRVLFPWSRRGLAHARAGLTPEAPSRLRLERSQERPPLGTHSGFEVEDMADVVSGQIEQLDLSERLAPLVLVMGHGSTSLNNPQESAHDCGACAGGQGGPNARALAQMANDPRVRSLLDSRGIRIPPATWFVGGQRNTANNDVTFYDEDLVPEPAQPLLRRARAALEEARVREAQERCRWFESAPAGSSPRAALSHVQGRSVDLAQPRPEYGHATNAFCVVGRRSRTRGLFLDRRAFLVSYDPSRDAGGEALERLLAAVVPVVAGINLEYFFGYVDPTGYGCGTKLPHNVTGLLGVMDGAESDLRTGLPWQMLEIHESVRLLLVVEASHDVLRRALERDAQLKRLVDHRWIALASLDPTSQNVAEYGSDGFRRHVPERPAAPAIHSSLAHCRAGRGHLEFVPIGAASEQAG